MTSETEPSARPSAHHLHPYCVFCANQDASAQRAAAEVENWLEKRWKKTDPRRFFPN